MPGYSSMIDYTREYLNSLDLSKFNPYLHEYVKGQFHEGAGSEHYRLLTEISKGKKLVYDIGTYRGASAIALSNAEKVVTCDIQHLLKCELPENVRYKIGNCIGPDLLKADLILVDTFHDGTFEREVYSYLEANNYKGILLLDDIYLNAEMKSFWVDIDLPKQDLTYIGHYSGTGIVFF